jgi:hypothetical protein
MTSTRYFLPALLLLLLALVPTVFNFYRGLPVTTTGFAESLPLELGEMAGADTGRRPADVNRIFQTEDWVERVYTDGNSRQIILFLARGYDARPFFHYPEGGVLWWRWSTREHKTKWMDGPSGPVQTNELFLRSPNLTTRALYVFMIGGKPAENPYLSILKQVPRMLMGKREPYHLIFVHESGNPAGKGSDQAMESLLTAALDYVKGESGRP